MDQLTYYFAAVVLLASMLASVAIWAPRATWVKVGALCLTAALLPTTYGSFVELLGKPKPVSLEWANDNMPEATVLGASWRENEAIYLWLRRFARTTRLCSALEQDKGAAASSCPASGERQWVVGPDATIVREQPRL